MYGSGFYSDFIKYGEKQVIQFKIQMPNPKHVLDDNLFEEILDILNEVINNPLAENGAFNKEYFDNEVKNLRDEILGRVNDKMNYAYERSVEIMCQDEPFRINELGDLENLKEITPENLYAHYMNILKESDIDICAIGDIDFDHAENLIREKLIFNVEKSIEYPKEIISVDVDKVKIFEEKFKVQQGKIAIGYRSNTAVYDELYEASILFANILGGGANSKLFKNVREKESLCYYINARNEKYKAIMIISSGIEFDNYHKVIELIDVEFKNMIEGEFTDEDMKIAKDNMISNLNAISDYPNTFMNYYYSTVISGGKFNIEERKKTIASITKNEVIEAGKRIVKDTVYFLNKEDN